MTTDGSALATDLYELTMAAGYWTAGMDQRASFELYVRELPEERNYLLCAGLEQALDYLEGLRFTSSEIDYLRHLPVFGDIPGKFFDEFLPSFSFSGDVCAIEEGTPVFAQEPFLRVTAPLIEAQLVETALLALVTFQTSIASKASRVVEAAGGRAVVEFGARRAHGLEAGVLAARASYLAGCAGTSSVEAGHRYGIPVSGTMAHSWVMAFDSEIDAFRHYEQVYGGGAVLLVDTYDSIRAIERVIAEGMRPPAIRLDSGDVVAESRTIRQMLDEAGLQDVGIFISGDLDEYKIRALVENGGQASGFGVGTALSTSKDAPALGGVYKLVEIERGVAMAPVVKRSPGKASYAGCKQVWRSWANNVMSGDVLALADEPAPAASTALLEPVMKEGRRLRPSPRLSDLRSRCSRRVAELPPELRRLDSGRALYRVEASERLRQATAEAAGADGLRPVRRGLD